MSGDRQGLGSVTFVAPKVALWIAFQTLLSHATNETVLFEMGAPLETEPPQILVHDHEFETKPRKGSPYVAIRHMGKNVEPSMLPAAARKLSRVNIPLGLHFGGTPDCEPKHSNFVQISDEELGFFLSTESLADCGNFKRVLGGGQNIVLGYDFPIDAPTNIWRQAKNQLRLDVSLKLASHNLIPSITELDAASPVAQMSFILFFSSTSRPDAQAIRYVIPFFDSRGTSSSRVMSDRDGAFFISSTISGDRYTERASDQARVTNETSEEYQRFLATISTENISAAISDLNEAIDKHNHSRSRALPKITTDTTELRLESVGILTEVLFDFGADGPELRAAIEGWGHIEIGGAIKEFRVTEISPDGDPPARVVPIYGHYSPIIKDHFYSRIEGEPVRLGYLREGLAFSVYPDPVPSSRKLFQCALNRHHFLSTNKDCEGAELQSTLGWVRLGLDNEQSWTPLINCTKGMHSRVITSQTVCKRGFETKIMDAFVTKSP